MYLFNTVLTSPSGQPTVRWQNKQMRRFRQLDWRVEKRLKIRRRNERERWQESREEVWRRTRQGVDKGLVREART